MKARFSGRTRAPFPLPRLVSADIAQMSSYCTAFYSSMTLNSASRSLELVGEASASCGRRCRDERAFAASENPLRTALPPCRLSRHILPLLDAPCELSRRYKATHAGGKLLSTDFFSSFRFVRPEQAPPA